MDLILQLAFPFTAHVFVGALVLVFIIRKKWARIALIFLTLLLGYQLVKTQQSRKKAISLQQANTIKVTLFQLNLNVENTDLSILINYFKKNPADLVVLQEVNPTQAQQLRKNLEDQYPTVFSMPASNPFGSMILSRFPMLRAERQIIPKTKTPYSHVVLEVPSLKTPLHLYEIHAYPPINQTLVEERKQALEGLARIIADNPSELKIVVGDLNLTPYNPLFEAFERKLSIRRISGLKGTWPMFLPSFLRIAIDHCFISGKIAYQHHAILRDDFNSDHAAQRAELLLIP